MHSNTGWIAAFSDGNTEWTLRHWRAIIADLHTVWAYNMDKALYSIPYIYMSEYIILMLHFLKLLLLTLLVGSVFYIVGSISKVCDQGICTAPRWVADEGFDVVASILCESPSIHGEVCGRLTENTWKHK